MEKRRLGAGGPEVSAIGIGAMSFGGFYGPTSEAESHALLSAALDLGVDHIDTANVYGMGVSETVIGSFLRGRKGRRRFASPRKARSPGATTGSGGSIIRPAISAASSTRACSGSASRRSISITCTDATPCLPSRRSRRRWRDL